MARNTPNYEDQRPATKTTLPNKALNQDRRPKKELTGQKKTQRIQLLQTSSAGDAKGLALRTGRRIGSQDGGEIGGNGVHFPSTPVKYLADLRSRGNSHGHSSIYEDRRPKIEDTERSDSKKSA